MSKKRRQHRLREDTVHGSQIAEIGDIVAQLAESSSKLDDVISNIDMTNPSVDTADLEEAADSLSHVKGSLSAFVNAWESRQRQELATASKKR